MSDTPTFASLLTQWIGGDTAARESVYVHLRANPADAAALEAAIRNVLRTGYPRKRVIAAEAMVEVYRDEAAALTALVAVLRLGDLSAVADAATVLRRLSPEYAATALSDLAFHAPPVFRSLPAEFHRWAGGSVARSGNTELWLGLFGNVGAERESPFLMGLADAAPGTPHDLSPLKPTVDERLFDKKTGCAAGAALWRMTWRFHREWLTSLNPHSPRLENDSALLVLLIEVLTEHLGRRPNLAPVVRELLVRLGHEHTGFWQSLGRLAGLGGRGWAVLLPILGDGAVPANTRRPVFVHAARRPGVLPLAHHHAHGVVLARTDNRDSVTLELLDAAVKLLGAIGAPASSALPDLLNLIVTQPETAKVLAPAIPALAAGFPTPVAAVARTLDRLRRSVIFSPEAFVAVAEVFAAMSLDSGPALAGDTNFDPRTPDSLLQQPAWQDAAPEVRRKHALALADMLGAPRAEVRARAATLLRHYTDQLPAVWPALVALLAGGDEKAVLLALPYFRHLTPVAVAVVPELTALFREPNPAYAARAVVGLWRLGRMSLVTNDLRKAVVDAATDDAWGWAVLRGVLDRVFQSHVLLRDLSELFAAAPAEVAAKVQAMLNPPESAEEAAISVHVPPDNPDEPQPVNWNGVYQCVCNDTEGGLLFLALMCAHGSAGFAAQKIWMIKHNRMLTGHGLADAKQVVERAIDRLTATATAGDRHACVRDYFGQSPGFGLPKPLIDLLDHRLSWYRWAGLELLDAWGDPARVGELLEDRLWDRSTLVRTRALRMRSR